MTETSLRAHQRQDILQRLHLAAMDLVQGGDLSDATVEAIADRVGVSRRTFFNYYATKEDAVLGTTAPVVSEAARAAFNDLKAEPDEFVRIVALVSMIVHSTRGMNGSDAIERRKLLIRFPLLRARLQQHTNAAEGLAEGIVVDHYLASGRAQGSATKDARQMLVLAAAVTRYAYLENSSIIDNPTWETVRNSVDAFKAAVVHLT